MSERPDASDDLTQAYAKAHTLAGDAGGPAAAVRANVLAAARAVAAEASARAAAEVAATLPLTPVAPPVADVGSGRPKAINLSSWRIRSGAALAAMLLVGVAGWHFDAARRADSGEQVAMAELRLAAPQTSPLPQELPVPPLPGASYPYVPPPVVEEPADGARRPLAKQATRDKDTIVAQLDQAVDNAARAAAAAPLAATPARKPQPAAAPPAPGVVADATTSASVAAIDAPEAKARAADQDPVTVTIRAEPMQVATAPPKLPSVVPRRVVVPAPAPAPVAAAPPPGETVVAAAEPVQRVEIAGSRIARSDAGDAAKKSLSGAAGSLVTASARVLPASLHAAADHGDVETLKKLLANPSTPVDAPDAAGRTALLHAVLAQQPAAVRLLLAAGADPARADPAGLTPRAAAQAGASAEIATLLAAPR